MSTYFSVRKINGSFTPFAIIPPSDISAKLTSEHPISACKYADDNTPVFVVMADSAYDAVNKVETLTKMFVR